MNLKLRNLNDSHIDSNRWALEEIKSSYILKEVVGEGCFGTVRRVRLRNRGKGIGRFFQQPQYACKTIPKSKVDDLNMLKEECSNLETVRGHPHILEFEQTFEDDKEVHIITELLEGSDLYSAVISMKNLKSYFRDSDAAWMIRNILDALSYCHDVAGIVHRDMKASNFMFRRDPNISVSNKQGDSGSLREIKIIDFGLSTTVDPSTGKVEGCLGTPYYVAPEVLTEEPYDAKCDVWSAGVLAYLILSKTLPYQGKDEAETLDMLMHSDDHQPKYESLRWLTVDPDAVAFCKALLKTNPEERPTAREAMKHPWIVKHCGSPTTQRSLINPIHSIDVIRTERASDLEEALFPNLTASFSLDSMDSLQREPPGTNKTFMESIPETVNGKKIHLIKRWFLGSASDFNHGANAQEISPSNERRTKSKRTFRTKQKTHGTLIMTDSITD